MYNVGPQPIERLIRYPLRLMSSNQTNNRVKLNTQTRSNVQRLSDKESKLVLVGFVLTHFSLTLAASSCNNNT